MEGGLGVLTTPTPPPNKIPGYITGGSYLLKLPKLKCATPKQYRSNSNSHYKYTYIYIFIKSIFL
jgi:hypothetical protein